MRRWKEGIAQVSTIRAKFVNLFWTDPKLLEIILFDFNGLISFTSCGRENAYNSTG
jgi:hypothetical protein